MMVCRIWHGWTTTENSHRYEEIVRGEVIPAIEARRIPGFLAIDLVRRPVSDGFEFATIMWFTDIEAVKAFVGEDYEAAHVPERAQEDSHASTQDRATTTSWIAVSSGHHLRDSCLDQRIASKSVLRR